MTVKTTKNARNYSVIIVSDATSTNKEFTVSSKLVSNAVLGFSFLVLFFGFILFHYLTMTLDKQKMERLESDAKEKRQKISEMSSTIEVLNDRLKKMEIYKERIMVATGLTSPLALREVGSGGPDTSLPGGGDFPALARPGPRNAVARRHPAGRRPTSATRPRRSRTRSRRWKNTSTSKSCSWPPPPPSGPRAAILSGSFRQPPAPVHRPLRVP